MYLLNKELADVLSTLCVPGDFARGQRTLPNPVIVPHGYFARGQVADMPRVQMVHIEGDLDL